MRALVPDDLPAIAACIPAPATRAGLAELGAPLRLRHTHHSVARLLAEGNDDITTAFISGYTPEYIRMLKKNPAFAELLSHYDKNREDIHSDLLAKMAALGENAVEELQRRLDEAPDDWTRRELMELAELMGLRSRASTQPTSSGANGGVQLNINFVKAPEVIDVTPEK